MKKLSDYYLVHKDDVQVLYGSPDLYFWKDGKSREIVQTHEVLIIKSSLKKLEGWADVRGNTQIKDPS